MNQIPSEFLEQRDQLVSILTSGQEIVHAQSIKLAQSSNSTKDSGIGTTYLTVSSGSSSTNTSPESEKDALAQNGKPPKPLTTSKIDATSTPALASKPPQISRIQEETRSDLGSASSTPTPTTNDLANINTSDVPQSVPFFQSPTSRPHLSFSVTDQLGPTTPYVTRKRGRSIRTGEPVETRHVAEAVTWALAETGKRLQLSPRRREDKSSLVDTPSESGSRRRQRRMHHCEHCEKQFDRPSLLKRHTLTHTGERPFECRFCAKGFSTRSGVNTHERTHTGQRPYVCRICGRRFAAGSNLIFHKYTHSNTRRHQCSQCPKAFVTPGDLRKHEYTHTGLWPFRCAVCERGFATERNLKSHEVTHTGQKPFVCPVCQKGYAQESSMKTHLRTHQKALSDDGDKALKRNAINISNNAVEDGSSMMVASRQPINSVPATVHKPLYGDSSNVYAISALQAPSFASSPAISASGVAQLNQDAQSRRPRSAAEQRPGPVLLHSDPHQASAFSTPPSRPKLVVERTMGNTLCAESPDIAWFYERYRAYYSYYISSLAGTQQIPDINFSFPGVPVPPAANMAPPLPLSSGTASSTSLSPQTMWPVRPFASDPVPQSAQYESFMIRNTTVPPSTQQPLPTLPTPSTFAGPPITPATAIIPSSVPLYSIYPPQWTTIPRSAMNGTAGRLNAIPTENDALDYSLSTLSKRQPP